MKRLPANILSKDAKIISETAGENSHIYIIQDKNTKYILRAKKITRTDPSVETAFLKRLHKQQLPLNIPLIVSDQDPNNIIFRYIEGDTKFSWHEAAFTESQIRQIFFALAKFHNIFAHIKVNDLPRHDSKQFLKELNTKEADDMLAEISEYDELPIYPTHNDFHGGNLLWKDERLVGLIDWEWCRYATFEWEFCKSCSMLCCHFSKDKRYEDKKLKVAWDEYNKVADRRLDDTRVLQTLMKLTCFHHMHWALGAYKKNPKRTYLEFVESSKQKLLHTDFHNLF